MKISIIKTACCLFLFLIFHPIFAATLEFEISGLKGEPFKNAEARLAILKKADGENLTEEQIRSIYSNVTSEIKQAIEPYGYFKSIVHTFLSKKNDHAIIYLQVEPGPQLTITYLDVKITGEGKDNKSLQAFLQAFPLKTGDPLSIPNYEKAKEKLFLKANNQGYIKSFLEKNQVYVDLKTNRASIILHLNTGPLYYYGTVQMEGKGYSQSFLKRFIKFKSNEHFSSKKLSKLQQQLVNSYYFQQAQVVPDFLHTKDQHVPVKVAVTPPKAKRYTAGVGYGTLTGPRLIAGMNLRHLNDEGHHFEAQLKLSSVLSGMAAKYYIPGKNPLTDQWLLGLNYQRFNPRNGDSTSGTASAGYTKKINHFQVSSDINYLVENYKVEEENKTKHTLLYPHLNIAYSKADDFLHPTKGFSANLMLQGASSEIFSSTDFMQGELKAKYLMSPTDSSHLIFRGNAGMTVVHDLKKLPLSMRFFAGGLNTVRGYPDSGIGPGRYLKVASVEFQQHVTDNWSGALFYDAGTASNHWNKSLSKSEGVGVIYNSAIGPIKLYAAHAEDRPGKAYSIEFSIGPEF